MLTATGNNVVSKRLAAFVNPFYLAYPHPPKTLAETHATKCPIDKDSVNNDSERYGMSSRDREIELP